MLPADTSHIWYWFLDLDRARQVGMQANPIGFSDIAAYSSLMDISMQPWEVAAIRKVDDIALAARARKTGRGGKGGKDREPDALVSKADGAGVSSLMQGLAAKARKK